MRSKEDLKHKLGQLTKYYIRTIFTEKQARSIHQKLVSDLHFILVSIPKGSFLNL